MNLDIQAILSETDRDANDPVCVVTGMVPPEQFDPEAALAEPIPAGPAAIPGDFRYENPITVTVHARRTSAQEVLLEIDAEIRYSMECARCAGRSVKSLALREMVVYFGAPGDAARNAGKIVHDEEEFTLTEFKLFDELRQNLELALPLKFLCDPACRGLCPVCGENRNQADCGHGGARHCRVPAAADTLGARLGLLKKEK